MPTLLIGGGIVAHLRPGLAEPFFVSFLHLVLFSRSKVFFFLGGGVEISASIRACFPLLSRTYMLSASKSAPLVTLPCQLNFLLSNLIIKRKTQLPVTFATFICDDITARQKRPFPFQQKLPPRARRKTPSKEKLRKTHRRAGHVMYMDSQDWEFFWS